MKIDTAGKNKDTATIGGNTKFNYYNRPKGYFTIIYKGQKQVSAYKHYTGWYWCGEIKDKY